MSIISLLPPEIKGRRQARRNRIKYAVLGGLSCLVLLGIYSVLVFAGHNAKTVLNETKNDRITIESRISDLEKYQVLQNKVERVNTVYSKAMSHTPAWDRLLLAVGSKIPNGVWITDLIANHNQEDGNTASELTIRGFAYSHSLVGEWLEELKSFEQLKDVKGSFSVEATVGSQTVTQYEIEALVKETRLQ